MKCSTSNIVTTIICYTSPRRRASSSRLVSFRCILVSSRILSLHPRLVSFHCIIIRPVESPFRRPHLVSYPFVVSSSRILSLRLLFVMSNHHFRRPHLASSHRILSLHYYSSCRITISVVHISHRLVSFHCVIIRHVEPPFPSSASRVVLYRLISCRIVSCHLVSCRIISYRRTFVS